MTTGSAPVWRVPVTDVDTAQNTLTTTTYASLASAAPAPGFTTEIEVTVTTGTVALVLFKAGLHNDTGGSSTLLSYSVSSATTVAAADTHSIRYEASNAADIATFGGFDLRTGLTAGSNVFTLEARVTANTGTIEKPEIAVIPF